MVIQKINFTKLFIALGIIIISISAGIIGFMTVEDYSFNDALYMTLITVSTVGYREVKPLSENGRLFTAIYIFFNLGILAYILSIISTYVFEGELRQMLTNYRIIKKLKKLEDHIIVCGFGRNGSKACEELLNSDFKIVVIDSNDDVHEEYDIKKHPKIFFIKGDATHDEILKAAGIEHARALISTLPKDADNVFVTLTARQMNHNIKIISRASEQSSESKLVRAGVNNVVMPDAVGGRHMATLVTKPHVVEFIELMNGIGENSLNLDNIPFDELKQEYQGQSIGELDIRKKTGATVIAIRDQYGFNLNPSPSKVLSEGQTMILLGKKDELQLLKDYRIQS